MCEIRVFHTGEDSSQGLLEGPLKYWHPTIPLHIATIRNTTGNLCVTIYITIVS